MDTILDSKTSTETSVSSSEHIKAASAPLIPLTRQSEEAKLTTQISAPSYLFSLNENDAPPFKLPEKAMIPRLMIGTIMNEDDAIAMIAASDACPIQGMKKFLGNFLVEKKITQNYNLRENNFLIGFLMETVDYSARRDFSTFKLACLITIYLSSHLYFKFYYWLSPKAVWNYFKENMIRHTIEDSPDGQEVFSPDECYDIVTHFHTIYLSNLPLVHILTFGTYRLKLMWPFKPK